MDSDKKSLELHQGFFCIGFAQGIEVEILFGDFSSPKRLERIARPAFFGGMCPNYSSIFYLPKVLVFGWPNPKRLRKQIGFFWLMRQIQFCQLHLFFDGNPRGHR